MIRLLLLSLLLAGPAFPQQDPFQPLDFSNPGTGVLNAQSARRDWVKITNQRLELQHKTARVASEDSDSTAVVLLPGVSKARQAKPVLLGKDEWAPLMQGAMAAGFTRLLVRNPDTGKQWTARFEKGKPVLED
jgi:hypothetical protein